METKLQKGEINSVSIYYENLIVRTDDGDYFLSPNDLPELLNQHDYQKVHKKTRTWLKPIQIDDAGTIVMSDTDNEKLTEVLTEFELKTQVETGIKRISGGYAQADYTSHDTEYIYITLKWGVQSDVDNDTHEEDWKIPQEDFFGSDSVKEIVRAILPCN